MPIPRLIYLAHPIGGAPLHNAALALEYLRAAHIACKRVTPRPTIIAPYIHPILEGWDHDDDPDDRERGIQSGRDIASRCWAVAPVGSHVSAGMAREIEACGRAVRGLIGWPPAEAAQRLAAFLTDALEGWS